MENLSATLRHCYDDSFLHRSLFRRHSNLIFSNHSPIRSSLDVSHASFKAIPISVSLGPPSSTRFLSSHGSFDPSKELNACGHLVSVKASHARMMKQLERLNSDSIARCLISRYLEFGGFEYAIVVFFTGFARNQVSWKDFLEEVGKFGGERHKVLEGFIELQNKGVIISDEEVLVMVLRICTVLMSCSLGFAILACLIKKGYDHSNTFVTSALMNFYGRCGISDTANKVFDELPERDDLVWNEAVMMNLRCGRLQKALELFREMQFCSVSTSITTMVKLLQVCGKREGLTEGKQIHGYTLRHGFESNIYVCNSLIVMYSRNGLLDSSKRVFDFMGECNLSSWNSIISSYTKFGYMDEANSLVDQMISCGLKPDIITWNSLLSGYAFRGSYKDAILILKKMRLAGYRPDTSSISSLLQAVADSGHVKFGKEIHGYVIRNGLGYDIYVETSLINVYVKNSCLRNAKAVFDSMRRKNIVAWNSLMSGFSYTGLLKDAEELMIRMEKEGIKPDIVTWNSLIFGYASSGKLEEALAMVEKMKDVGEVPDVVSWTALLSGCSKNGNFIDALDVFVRMQENGVCPNSATVSSLLKTLSGSRLLDRGKEVHCFCLKNGSIRSVYVTTALVDMYVKSGDLQSASEVFHGVGNKTRASWNCMIMGHAVCGRGEDGITVFEEMLESGIEPDAITFTSLLSCCKNSGLIGDGWKYYDLMRSEYGITPTIEHYSCIVDLLGKSGYLDEAWDFIRSMPLKADETIWGALLASCRIHGNVQLAEIAWKKLQVLEPNNSANYMMMMNLYAALNRWKDVEGVRDLMRIHRVKVRDVWSWIEIDRKVHIFKAEGEAHPEEGEIYYELYGLVSEMKKLGYSPDTRCIYQNVDESEKVKMLMGHTEKLAMTYGLMKKKTRVAVRVVKNTRICSDCHSVAKYMSLLRGREIVVNDGARVHCFRDGKCSCNDVW